MKSSRWTINRKSSARLNHCPYYRLSSVNTVVLEEAEESEIDQMNSLVEPEDRESIGVKFPSILEETMTDILPDGDGLSNDTTPIPNSFVTEPKVALANWAVSNKVTHRAVNGILNIIREFYDSTLPLDARTLLNTPKSGSIHLKELCGGQYHYFRIEDHLVKFLKLLHQHSELNFKNSNNGKILMRVNFDGIPIHRSTNFQLWPILVQFFIEDPKTIRSEIDIASIFYGKAKPNNLEQYLEEFIESLLNIMNGFEYEETVYNVELAYFVCDAPARQFLKSITSHNGYWGCERCTQKGIYRKTVVFPKQTCSRRTDADFFSHDDEHHHKGFSPLLELNIGLVSKFVLDPMHLIYLGVMRKLLNLWLKGPLNIRIGKQSKDKISNSLNRIASCTPIEINRKPRSLDELDRFKATEFRTFLLYTGVFVLKRVLPDELYNNFLLLSVSINLLCRTDILGSIDHAEVYLGEFLKQFKRIYGKSNMVYNVHNLCHIVDDVRMYGTLDSFSAFPFENFLGSLKSSLRKPGQSLAQILNRIKEKCKSSMNSELTELKEPSLSREHDEGPLLDTFGVQYKTLHCSDFILKLNPANSGFMVGDKIGIAQNFISCHLTGRIRVLYKCFMNYENYFMYPTVSADIGIYKVSNLNQRIKSCSVNDISAKYMIIPLSSSEFLAMPMLHSLQDC